MICHDCQSALPDLLLDPSSPAHSAARAHVESCPDCRRELESLQQTMSLLDTWDAPEVSPYFDQRMAVRLREEQAKAPESWLEHLRSRLLFNTGRQFRPALAGALALLLLIGGGTVANFSSLHPARHETSAAVTDLQVLDRNDQALQTMDQLLQDDNDDEAMPLS